MTHSYATAVQTSLKIHARKPSDFYPTPPDVTEALMRFLQLDPATTVWEPACGDGAMSRILERHCNYVSSTDIRDELSIYGVGGIDFLQHPHTDGIDWIITNPPFNIAADFIRKALSIAPNVAMLLKSQYWHAASRLSLFEDHRPAFVLPLTWRPAFLEAERGRSPLMDVNWVVWRNGSTLTEYAPLVRPEKIIPLSPLPEPALLIDDLAHDPDILI